MEFEPFNAAWQRWDRAQDHMRASTQAWNEYLDADDAFDFTLDHEGDGVFVMRVHQVKPSPPELSVALGEWLYNLRATLDYLIWATACYVSGKVPPPNEGVLQYPIYDEEAAWKRNEYRLKGLHAHHREMLLTMQPFNSDRDANYLGWLNRLARIDRHRTLVTGAARLAQLDPVLQLPHGCTAKVEWGERTVVDGRADAARFTVSPYREGMDVRVNPRAGIDPEIGEWSRSPFWGRIAFDERLKTVQVFVAAEIAAYEYDCTGASRKADLVTEEYQDIMDARRGDTSTLQRVRDEVKWEPAETGRASTHSRFIGEDFPADGPASRDAWDPEPDED